MGAQGGSWRGTWQVGEHRAYAKWIVPCAFRGAVRATPLLTAQSPHLRMMDDSALPFPGLARSLDCAAVFRSSSCLQVSLIPPSVRVPSFILLGCRGKGELFTLSTSNSAERGRQGNNCLRFLGFFLPSVGCSVPPSGTTPRPTYYFYYSPLSLAHSSTIPNYVLLSKMSTTFVLFLCWFWVAL